MISIQGSCALRKQHRCLRSLLVVVCTLLILRSWMNHYPEAVLLATVKTTLDFIHLSPTLRSPTIRMFITRIPNLDWRTTLTFYQLPPPGNTTYQSTLVSRDGTLDLHHRRNPTDSPPSDVSHLAILQWNALHLSSLKLAELDQLAHETHYDILALCEVHPKNDRIHPPHSVI